MAELARSDGGCCTPAAQAACCEPSEKQDCCTADGTACGCQAGDSVLETREQLEHALAAAGLADIDVSETHRVDAHAGAAIIRATKPS